MCLPKILSVSSFALVGVILVGFMLGNEMYWYAVDVAVMALLIVSGIYMFNRCDMQCTNHRSDSASEQSD